MIINFTNWAVWLLYVAIGVFALRAAGRRKRLTWGVSWAGLGLTVPASGMAFAGAPFLPEAISGAGEIDGLDLFLLGFDALYMVFLGLFLAVLFWWKKPGGVFDCFIFLGCLLPLGRILYIGWFLTLLTLATYVDALRNMPR